MKEAAECCRARKLRRNNGSGFLSISLLLRLLKEWPRYDSAAQIQTQDTITTFGNIGFMARLDGQQRKPAELWQQTAPPQPCYARAPWPGDPADFNFCPLKCIYCLMACWIMRLWACQTHLPDFPHTPSQVENVINSLASLHME